MAKSKPHPWWEKPKPREPKEKPVAKRGAWESASGPYKANGRKK